MEKETVFPHCTCIKQSYQHKYLSVTTSSDGETCDKCSHYVVWKPLNSKFNSAGRESDDDLRWKHSQKAFFLQEYKVCL